MAINKEKSHVWVVPEDDANRQLANGFQLNPALRDTCIQIAPVSGGWLKVLKDLEKLHIAGLEKFPARHLVLLIDFDEDVDDRLALFRERVPLEVANRVYVLGTRDEPEPLRKDVGRSLEKVGGELAEACANDESGLWSHEFLKHNQPELDRLTAAVKPFLFR